MDQFWEILGRIGGILGSTEKHWADQHWEALGQHWEELGSTGKDWESTGKAWEALGSILIRDVH